MSEEVFKGFGPKFHQKILEISVGEGILAKGESIKKLGQIVESLNSTKKDVEKIKEIQIKLQKLEEEKAKIEAQIKEKMKELGIDEEKLQKFFNSQVFTILSAVEVVDPELAIVFKSQKPTVKPANGAKRILIYKGREITMSELRQLVPELPKSYTSFDILNVKSWKEKLINRIEEKNGKVYIYLKETL